MRKSDFLPMQEQRHSDCKADQRLCFRNMDSTISLSSSLPASGTVQVGLCQNWSELVGDPEDCLFRVAAQF